MTKAEEFFRLLTNQDMCNIYLKEYLIFKDTAVIPLEGKMRELCKVNSELLNGCYDIDFAIKLFLEEWSYRFFKLHEFNQLM